MLKADDSDGLRRPPDKGQRSSWCFFFPGAVAAKSPARCRCSSPHGNVTDVKQVLAQISKRRCRPRIDSQHCSCDQSSQLGAARSNTRCCHLHYPDEGSRRVCRFLRGRVSVHGADYFLEQHFQRFPCKRSAKGRRSEWIPQPIRC